MKRWSNRMILDGIARRAERFEPVAVQARFLDGAPGRQAAEVISDLCFVDSVGYAAARSLARLWERQASAESIVAYQDRAESIWAGAIWEPTKSPRK